MIKFVMFIVSCFSFMAYSNPLSSALSASRAAMQVSAPSKVTVPVVRTEAVQSAKAKVERVTATKRELARLEKEKLATPVVAEPAKEDVKGDGGAIKGGAKGIR